MMKYNTRDTEEGINKVLSGYVCIHITFGNVNFRAMYDSHIGKMPVNQGAYPGPSLYKVG